VIGTPIWYRDDVTETRRHTLKVRLLPVLCSVLLTVGPAAYGAAPGSGGVVPGQAVGSLRLGTPVTALYQMPGWGQPDRVHASGSISYMTYGRHGVMAAIRDSAVVLILTTSDRYRTDKGVAVGQGASAVAAAYGQPATGGDGRTLWYDGIGLVAVTGGGTIVRLGVYDPKQFVRAILAEEQPARDVFVTARPPKFEAPAATASDTAGAGASRAAVVTVTLKNISRGAKVLTPNFFTLIDREGQRYRYDRSTFSQTTACRSTVSVQPGESKTCAVVFLLPAGKTPRSLTYSDGASLDEFYF
jgi:hypothetical protein